MYRRYGQQIPRWVDKGIKTIPGRALNFSPTNPNHLFPRAQATLNSDDYDDDNGAKCIDQRLIIIHWVGIREDHWWLTKSSEP